MHASLRWLVVVALAACSPVPPGDAPEPGDDTDVLAPEDTDPTLDTDVDVSVVHARVQTADGVPVAGATVKLGDTSATTDAQGAAHLSPAPRGEALVEVEADGFAPGFAAVEVDAVDVIATVTLAPAVDTTLRDATAGGVVNVGKLTMVFPGAAVVDPGGARVGGVVAVHAAILRDRELAAAPQLMTAGGGGLRAAAIFEVRLDAGGQPAQVTSDVPFRFDVGSGAAALDAPQLYTWSREHHVWEPVGDVTVDVGAGTVAGALPHFSWYAVAEPVSASDLGCLSGTVTWGGVPVPGATLWAQAANGVNEAHAADDGTFCVQTPWGVDTRLFVDTWGGTYIKSTWRDVPGSAVPQGGTCGGTCGDVGVIDLDDPPPEETDIDPPHTGRPPGHPDTDPDSDTAVPVVEETGDTFIDDCRGDACPVSGEDCDPTLTTCPQLRCVALLPDFSNPVAVALDPDGGIVMTGTAIGTLDILGTTITAPSVGFWVARTDADCQPTWVRVFPSTYPNEVRSKALAVGPTGEVYVAGVYDDTVDLGGGALPGQPSFPKTYDPRHLFLLKLDPDGTFAWSQGWRSGTSSFGAKLAGLLVDDAGDVYVAGRGRGQTVAGQVVSSDGFVVSLGPTGTRRWIRTFTKAVPETLTYDGAGRLLVASTLFDVTDFGGGFSVSPVAGHTIGVAARLGASNGATADVRTIWSSLNDHAVGIGDATLWWGTSALGDPDLGWGPVGGQHPLNPAVIFPYVGFAQLLDAAWSPAWGVTWGGGSGLADVDVDGGGHLLLAGGFTNDVRVGAVTYDFTMGRHALLVEVLPDGSVAWSRAITTVDPAPYRVARASWSHLGVAPDGSFAVVGDIDGIVDFGQGPVGEAGVTHRIVARFDR